MPVTTTTEFSAPINNVFQMTLLRNAKALCPYYKGSQSAEIMYHSGTFTAKWRRYENMTPTTTALTEITGAVAFPTRQGTQPTVTDLTAVVAKYGDFIYLTEEVDLLNFNNQTDKLAEILGIQAGRSLNRLQRNVLEDNFTILFPAGATTATDLNGGSTASAHFKLADIQNSVNILDRNDAMKFTAQTSGSTNVGSTPIRASYWAFVHPDVEADIRTITGFNAVETYMGQTEIADGEFGNVGGVRFIVTTESTIDAGTGATTTGSATTNGRAATGVRADVYNTPIIGQDSVGSVGFGFEHVKESYKAGDNLPGVLMISHPRGSAGAADPLSELSTAGWKSWHAGLVLNSTWGRTYRTVARNIVPL